MKSYPNYSKIYAAFNGAGRDVYVANSSYNDFKEIKDTYRHDYRLTSAYRAIISLNSDALSSICGNTSSNVRKIKTDIIEIEYKLHNGNVLIDLLRVTDPFSSQKSGLYAVKQGVGGQWEVGSAAISNMNSLGFLKSKSNKALYAAVCGNFQDKESAGRNIGEHVIKSYAKSEYFVPSDVNRVGAEFAMYYVIEGGHKFDEYAEELASIIQQSAKANVAVNWLIHGEGAHTLNNAAKILSAQPLADIGNQKMYPRETFTMGQRVYFSNPSITSENALKEICIKAGMEYVGVNANNRDIRKLGAMKNVGVEMGQAAMKTLGGGAVLGTGYAISQVGAAGIDKIAAHAISQFSSGNYLGVAFAVGAGIVTAQSVLKKFTVIRAGFSCTFGKGNQRWYTSDAELFK